MKRIIGFAVFLLFAGFSGAAPYPEAECELQWRTLETDLASSKHHANVYKDAYHRQAAFFAEDRDPLDVLLRRTAALASDLNIVSAELQAIAEQAKAVNPGTPERRKLFDELLPIRRRIAFANPLLDFDSIVLVTRDLSKVYEHVADQYYGIHQRAVGGLFVLENAFSDLPAPRSLTGDALPGSFLSPALSYDAKSVAFAHVACKGSKDIVRHFDHAANGHWHRDRSYHLFSINTDGSGLTQLTDGTFNDHSPCFTPAGRIAFMSERRGGFNRCGRVCPTYTLYDMAADGSDIRCLSYHDVNEWAPSVAHDGQLIWTRWDYVDRHGCTAHKPWITTPDGRNPRPLHGNYSFRSKRPDVETDVRAIPGSRTYIGTAAPHHGQSFGSLIVIDPQAVDDDAMGPVRRFTPEVGFPESQGDISNRQVYGTPWPLSEGYHLAAYAPTYSGATAHHAYGLYLVDKFGNKELIWRDPAGLATLSPIPFKVSKRQPIVTEQRDPKATTATVVIANIYQSFLPWPKDAPRIRALRVWQLYPLAVGSFDVDRNIGIQVKEGSDSINLARMVLGTVPVEEDGSVHFTVPAVRGEVFFQALDENGCAVQSMRSGVGIMPGEILSCTGCHEPKNGVPPPRPANALQAMRRAPSKLTPGPEGSRPFSYPRLVQPVLDKKCVSCHAENKEKAPRLDGGIVTSSHNAYMNRPTPYLASYLSLAEKYGFTSYGAGHNFNNPRFYRTTPGEFGARASKLYPMLKKGHHGVTLTDDEMTRIITWLDSVCQFYSVYEPEGMDAQLRGEIVWPTLE